ncbi:guanylate kinase [Patescibacteria group bacterium]|nr:guanylate kinase [Patescibacteria group bacterium]
MVKPRLKKTIFFIISGPSGAGEDSVIEGLGKKIKFERVITTVTRAKRAGEREGKPYHFITVPKFKKMIKNKEFWEWARVYGDYRGAAHKELNRLMRKKTLALWKVDYQGAETIKKKMPEVLSISISPPSLASLEKRLIKRGQDSLEVIKKRMPFTKKWLKHTKGYDYIVVNRENKLKETIDRVFKILMKSLRAASR